MSPPKLSADAPVFNVVHPMIVNLGPTIRIKSDLALGHGSVRFLHARVFHEPLLAQVRLDGDMAALAVADLVNVVLYFEKQFLFGEFFNDGLAGFEPVHVCKIFPGRFRHRRIHAYHNR